MMNVVTKGSVCINNENHNNVLSSILFNNALPKEYEIKRNYIGTKNVKRESVYASRKVSQKLK